MSEQAMPAGHRLGDLTANGGVSLDQLCRDPSWNCSSDEAARLCQFKAFFGAPRKGRLHSAATAFGFAEILAIWLSKRSAFFSSSRFCCNNLIASW